MWPEQNGSFGSPLGSSVAPSELGVLGESIRLTPDGLLLDGKEGSKRAVLFTTS